MEIFLDTANLEEIKRGFDTGLVDGITTNPTLVARENVDVSNPAKLWAFYGEICRIVDPKPVSLELTLQHKTQGLSEIAELKSIAENVVIKVAFTPQMNDLVKVVRYDLPRRGKVNVTLVFSAEQALLAAKAGAEYISIFVGRLDDVFFGKRGMQVVREALSAFKNYNYDLGEGREIIVASVRHTKHVLQSAILGAPIVTMPPKVFWKLFKYPLTDAGIEKFQEDWKEASKKPKAAT